MGNQNFLAINIELFSGHVYKYNIISDNFC